MKLQFYSKYGFPITVSDALTKLGSRKYWLIKKSRFGKGKTEGKVITAWIGLPPDDDEYEPLIFETVYISKRSQKIEVLERYSNLEQARNGHIAIMSALR